MKIKNGWGPQGPTRPRDPVTRSCESTWGLALKALLQSAMFRLTVEAAGPGSRVALSVSSLNCKLQHRARPAFTHLQLAQHGAGPIGAL